MASHLPGMILTAGDAFAPEQEPVVVGIELQIVADGDLAGRSAALPRQRTADPGDASQEVAGVALGSARLSSP